MTGVLVRGAESERHREREGGREREQLVGRRRIGEDVFVRTEAETAVRQLKPGSPGAAEGQRGLDRTPPPQRRRGPVTP